MHSNQECKTKLRFILFLLLIVSNKKNLSITDFFKGNLFLKNIKIL